MKKLLIRIVILAALLVLMNWIYSKWFFRNDLIEHSDMVELSWQVANDSCRIVYTGESSNHTYGNQEVDRGKISDYIGAYFPNVKMGDMTKSASHAQTYYYMLKEIPEEAPVETVVVTMNLRSFGANWIYSRLETALRKQLVLLQDYPPLVDRFLLAFKAYPIRSEEEWNTIVLKHYAKDPLAFPYDFPWSNTHQWDSAMAWSGWHDFEGNRDQELTELACHFIKCYGFTITDDNPRIKDFDAIVALCKKRGWHLVFNLMAENVDKGRELVGDDLLFLMKRNRDYLMHRYDGLEDVIVVDNLNHVRDVNFIDQNWTTEHYYGEGRKIIARRVAQAMSGLYPDEFQDYGAVPLDEGHYYFEEAVKLDAEMPYSPTLELLASDIRPEWGVVNVAFEMLQQDTLHDANLAVELADSLENKTTRYYSVKEQIHNVGQWDFATYALPLDSAFRAASRVKIFVYNVQDSPVVTKGLDISFRPAYLKPGVKGESLR